MIEAKDDDIDSSKDAEFVKANVYEVKDDDETGFESASSGFDRINYARKIFNDMFIRPVELWNQMITGYVSICDMKSARQVCDGIPKRDVVRVGDVENARGLFERMLEKNILSLKHNQMVALDLFVFEFQLFVRRRRNGEIKRERASFVVIESFVVRAVEIGIDDRGGVGGSFEVVEKEGD
ncbi:hypothetical protein LguiB_010485 [Lonicera macranthoides]